MAMKRIIGILAIAMMSGAAWAQNPNIINNVQSTMKSVQQKQTSDSNAALAVAGMPTQAPPAKPVTLAKSGTAVPTAQTAATSATTPVKRHDPMAPRTAQIKTLRAHPTIGAKPATAKLATTKIVAEPETKTTDAGKTADAARSAKPEDKKWAMTGKRDPFFSPVVQQPTGSGCSSGKKCLEIGQINLRGVVRSDGGFIAVVTNTLNKAYFLRENDPVFNGYVVKITGDSVVFQETVQDKLGKPLTREVVKRIFTPAV